MATLYDLAMQYLAQALPDGKIFPDTIPPLVPPTEDEDTSAQPETCLLYTSPSPRDPKTSRMPSSA